MTQTVSRTECSCATCRSYCKHVPGWFLPGEAERAATLKGLTLEAFFRQYLTVDYWASSDQRFVLRPRTTTESGGEIAGFDPRGVCVFYRRGRCAIHAAKPHECATARHDIDPSVGWHEQTAIAWESHQAHIEALLGRAPDLPDISFSDVFSLILRMIR